jgi:hypothetical protein
VAHQGIGYCVNCGARLEASHRFCWNCGTARWTPPPAPAHPAPAPPGAEGERPPPGAGTPVFTGRPAAAPARRGPGLLPWFFAAGAVFFLIEATEGLASLVSPDGRAQLLAELARQGVSTSMRESVLAAYWVIFIGGSLVAAALHGVAFHGLRRLRRWGWVSALVVAAGWSLVIVGIPILVRLMSRSVRGAFGID